MNKEEELRRDADDLKRMQQEHISKLDTNLLASSFDDLDEEHVAWLKKKSPKITGSISETSVIQTLQSNHPIIHVQLNQPIDYLDPRPEYIRVIIKWLTKSSISITHTVSPDTQRSLLSARRCEGLDGYS
ncbi:unnamed protein product [Rotaria magnacalcarata]|uniref:Uncharacterized protein n=1 Tax=Rotaria magnacalcarata TaxID=392030 RepID=A0A816UMM6_9BILA|nr:unnamed protein product [Rotaria magnacalcarata]CAF4099065.1 unnamed protein product [Rotaria magnacalcarata]